MLHTKPSNNTFIIDLDELKKTQTNKQANEKQTTTKTFTYNENV